MPIRYNLQINPQWKPHASYAIELLLDRSGWGGCQVEQADEADLVYAPLYPNNLSKNAIWICADSITDWNSSSAKVGRWDNIPFFYQTSISSPPAESLGRILPDIVYPTYALATGVFEQGQAKDQWGVTIAKSGILHQNCLLDIPVVALYADLLASELLLTGERSPKVPLWPQGKKYAIVLSHDVDSPFEYPQVFSALKEVKVNLQLKPKIKRTAWSVWKLTKAIMFSVINGFPYPDRDPNFCFDSWLEVEKQLGTRSAFYVASIAHYDSYGSPYDVQYSYQMPEIRRALLDAIDRGWEIGLHASINAHKVPHRIKFEKERLESVLDGYQVKGVRHHYWVMDSKIPERTLWLHSTAGFEYDTSLGLNDLPGFRRGIAWPFYPFDRQLRKRIPIVEIPPTLMDGGIFYHKGSTTKENADTIIKHIQQVSRFGGCVVLDWHLEQMNPDRYDGAGPILVNVLHQLVGDSSIFWATPAQVSDWWRYRYKCLTEWE